MTEFELFQALRPLYPAQEYALLPQVANGTGSRRFRHADAVALSLWPSRGLTLTGFEMKSYRGDWTRELKNPEKAEAIAQFCNYWWIVASGPFVKADEFPVGWGLLVWDETKKALKKAKAAAYREAVKPDLAFVAAMLRKAQDVCAPTTALSDQFNAGYAKAKEDAEENLKYELTQLRKLQVRVREIERISGIHFDTWTPTKRIGSAINLVINGSLATHREGLRSLAESILKDLNKAEFPEAQDEEDEPAQVATISNKEASRR